MVADFTGQFLLGWSECQQSSKNYVIVFKIMQILCCIFSYIPINHSIITQIILVKMGTKTLIQIIEMLVKIEVFALVFRKIVLTEEVEFLKVSDIGEDEPRIATVLVNFINILQKSA